MACSAGPGRRRSARYHTRHRVEGVRIRGVLRDLSVGGCSLHLDTRISPGTKIEAVCDISGLGVRVHGEVVWAEETGAGVFHGVLLTGFASEEDALFHDLYVKRLAHQARERAA